MSRKRLTPFRIAVLVALCLSGMRFSGCRVLELLDTRAVDLRLHYRGVEPASPLVAIVAIDDASIAQVGRWPWPRSTMARLLDAIAAQGPAVVGLDIVQSEESVAPVLRGLRDRVDGIDATAWRSVHDTLRRWSEEDDMLAAAVRRAGNVVLGYYFESGDGASGPPSQPPTRYTAVRTQGGNRGLERLPLAERGVHNLPALTKAATATGYFNVYPDLEDGLFRRMPLAIRYRDDVVLPLSLAMLHVYWGAAPTLLRVAEFGAEAVAIGDRKVPVAEDGRLLLNYRGPRRTVRHLSAADVLAGKVEGDALRGKLVLVGVTAGAVADVRATPFDALFPGVEIHATTIDNILREDYLMRPDFLVAVEVLVVLGIALVLAAALQRARGIWGALAAAVLAAAYVTGSQWLFTATGVALGLVFPVAAVVSIYVAVGVHQFAVEATEKPRMGAAFGRYVTPDRIE